MRVLIGSNEQSSIQPLLDFSSQYGEYDLVSDGLEVVEAFLTALDEDHPYQLICLDLWLPKIDGLKTLKIIRELEKEKEVAGIDLAKVIITSELSQEEMVKGAFARGSEIFAVKPIDIQKLKEVLKKFGLI